MRNLFAAVLIAAALAASASAAASRGTSGAQFLKLGAGARAGAMADAFTAVADDAFALYYNPAGLARLDRAQIGGGHTSLFQGITYQNLALAYPFGRAEGRAGVETTPSRHALGFGVFYLGVADIERRTGDSTNATGSFGAADAAYVAAYAYAPDDRLSLGVAGKYISQQLDTYAGSAFAADLGALYRLNPTSEHRPQLALSLRHLGSGAGYGGSKDPLPTTVVAAASVEAVPKSFLAAVEAGKARDTDMYAALGGEFRKGFGDGLGGALRFGYTSARRNGEGLNGITAGAGLLLPRGSFDFAWIPFGTLGDSIRFSLLLKF